MLRPIDQPPEAPVDPNQPLDIRELGISTGIVALVAIAMMAVFGALAGPRRSWLRPPWQLPPRAWPGVAILLALAISYLALIFSAMIVMRAGWYPSSDDQQSFALSSISVRVLLTPIIFAACLGLQSQLMGPISAPTLRKWAGWLALGAVAWLPMMLATSAVHLLTLWVKQQIGGTIDVHPLAKLRPELDGFGGVLFGLAVCVMTPWYEEFFFRGQMLPWAERARHRPWILVAWSLVFILATLNPLATADYRALLFAVLLALLLGVCQLLPKRHPKRTILAVVSTSAIFAAVHSSVWPNPIPLFVLALGLGYLTARTGSIVPAVVVHGLFNGASFVYLLRAPIT
jgi:membrane protease YdiL (CAAX protease family)